MRPETTSTIRAFALAGLCALLAAPGAAYARVGDVVALVAADQVSTAPAGRAGPTAGAGARAVALSAPLASALAQHGLDRVTPLGPESNAGGSAVRLLTLGSSAGALDDASAQDAARALVQGGFAIAAAVDRKLKLFSTIPNDSDLVLQWYVSGTGDIHLPQAWDLEKGSPSVVIGILDTGVDTGHPDLASKIWTNPGEIPGNGIDDDGNGYVDDVHGWDFGNGDNDPNPEPMFDDLGIDIAFHGTAVSGVAAAATDNVEGIAGAAWNCKILPLKITDTAGNTLLSAAGEGILYAAAKHIGVLNMSIGASNPDSATIAFFQAVIDQARLADVVCVGAAGNDGTSVPVAPAMCDGVLSVGSTTETNTRSSFSNYGPWVDCAAPGEGMWAPICRNYPIDDTSAFIYEFFYGYDGVSPYMLVDGTSFSCPLTSGVCALVRSHFPGAKAIAVMNQIKSTGDVIAFDQPIGTKVNAYNALLTPLDAGSGGAIASRLALAPARPSPFTSTTTLSFTLPVSGRVRLALVNAAGRRVRTLADSDESAGTHTIVWDGTDDAGRAAPTGLYFGVLEQGGERAVIRVARLGN